MKDVSKKHWISFFIILLFNISYLTCAPVIITSLVLGIGVSVFNVILCLFLIRGYLKEPLYEYGMHLKNVPTQIAGAVLLAFIVIFLRDSASISWTHFLYSAERAAYRFSSLQGVFSVLIIFIYVVPEEIVYRGFLLSFFEKIFKNSSLSIFLSAVLFGISHYPSYHNLMQVIYAFAFGMIFGYLRMKEPEKYSIFSLSLAHTINNLFLEMF